MNFYQRWKRRLGDWYGLLKIPRIDCDVAALPEHASVTLDFAAAARLLNPGGLPWETKLNSNATSLALAYRAPSTS